MSEADKKIDEIWGDDLLGTRKAEALFLVDFLTKRVAERSERGEPASYVLNLDSAWGRGKTFFLRRLQQQLEVSNYVVAYINAWNDDHADDPLLAVISGIDEAIAPLLKGRRGARKKIQSTWDATKRNGLGIIQIAAAEGMKTLAKRAVGEGFEEIAKLLDEDVDASEEEHSERPVGSASKDGKKKSENEAKGVASKAIDKVLDRYGENLLETFKKSKISIESFRKNLGVLLSQIEDNDEKKVPMFVLVDELDRCRPNYAISLLERVKHLFEVDRVIFIVATDTSQLQHSINSVYGSGFDSRKYLLRFFNRTYQFSQPEQNSFINSLFVQYHIDNSLLSSPIDDDHALFFSKVAESYGLALRDILQCFDMLRGIVTIWDSKVPIESVYMFPLIFAHQQGDQECFDALSRLDSQAVNSFKPWSIPLPRPQFHEDRNETEANGRDFIANFLSMAAQPLHKIIENRGRAYATQWVQERFAREFRILHNNTHYPAAPYRTVALQYPQLVREIGRLSNLAEE